MRKSATGLALLGALVATWPLALAAVPGPGPLPPPPPPPAPAPDQAPSAQGAPGLRGETREGRGLRVNDQPQQAAWRWVGPLEGAPRQLWVPLEVLQDQMGFSGRSRPDGALELEWFGQRRIVPATDQLSLADEVAVDVVPFLTPDGLTARIAGAELQLRAPVPVLRLARASAAPPGRRRVVLDLSGPAIVRSAEGRLWLAARVSPALTNALRQLGVSAGPEGEGWALRPSSAPLRVFTLGGPARVVIDMAETGATTPTAGAAPPAPEAIDPRLRALLGAEIQWSEDTVMSGGRRMRLNSVRIDPLNSSLELRPLNRGAGMEGLATLPMLARRHDALVAINGGYFNRVRRLPLGALRERGRWLSGPILNRGVVAWEPAALPRFGRLDLREWLSDDNGRQWPVLFVNSGFVRSGLARFTADWGPLYRALSGTEQAVLLRDGVVRDRFDSGALAAGVPLRPGEDLLVARGGAPLPWNAGTPLRLLSQTSSDLGLATNVMGGGPLLLLDGRLVLDGGAEGFSPDFLRQGAPRTVIGSDGRQLWLVTLQGLDDAGPTLLETARILRAAGLRDALNLDGGSSTGLVMGGRHAVKGRGVVAGVHNGLGLVPRATPAAGEATVPVEPARVGPAGS
ncbi:MAG: phosphodiester glycosidase family protein [Cyanobacteria bacterium K_Offshore_surface_m2_239]|nr:phosphodiester glycosidase family protein [Cyanobacteria bacterium K_Offshore_surface_m2_239]